MIQISDYIDIMLFLTFDLQFYVTFPVSMLQCVWFTMIVMINSCLHGNCVDTENEKIVMPVQYLER